MTPPSGPWLSVIPDNVPTELRVQPWVLWRAEPTANGKPAKVPYRVTDPARRASSTDPATWSAFADAADGYSALAGRDDRLLGPVAGIGVVLVQEREITCIDLDRVISDHGTLDPRAETIVDRCHSWTEISPSGTGLHVFVQGAVPAAIKGSQIEVYSTARFIAVTGHRWPGIPHDVRGAQDYLDWLYARARATEPPKRAYTGPATPPPDDLVGALLAKLCRWGIPAQRVKRWASGYLVEIETCPWSAEHTTGPGGAAVIIHASGAFDFTCLHAHCSARTWRDFRALMEASR